jgi:NTP pyrophosphatase (non-canonical NTP hydrolase)
MLTRQDIEDMGYQYYDEPYSNSGAKEATPMDMVQEFSKIMGQEPNPVLYATLIQEEFDEWFDARQSIDHAHELKELSDLVYVIFGYANAKGWNLMEATRRVHVNNMGRCMQPDGSVKRREDGKIIKCPDYPAVDLSELV